MAAKTKAIYKKTIQLLITALLITLVFSRQAQSAEESINPEQLFSQSAAKVFFDYGYEISNSADITGPKAETALLFYQAANTLDNKAQYIMPEMIRLIARHSSGDHSQMMLDILSAYVNPSCDLEVAREGIRYLMAGTNSREERETLLTQLSSKLGSKSQWINSDILTMLGILTLEKGDSQDALNLFLKAYSENKFNLTSFDKAAQLYGDKLPEYPVIEQLANAIRLNPYDLNKVLDFSQRCEKNEMFEIAANGYGYCAALSKYFDPEKPLPAAIYLPWALSSYNTQGAKHQAIEIAKQMRDGDIVDPVLEAIAYKAAQHVQETDQLGTIIDLMKKKAAELAEKPDTAEITKLAWFYCFGPELKDEALVWANKAYSRDPNSRNAAAILAYALTLNDQLDVAKNMTEGPELNQIAEIALAKTQITDSNNAEAIQTLEAAIEKDRNSLEALKAKELLKSLGAEYASKNDAKVMVDALESTFKKNIVPTFMPPQDAITLSLNVQGSKFAYGSEIKASAVIKNNSTIPIILSDDSFVKGDIRVNLKIRGDIQKDIDGLVIESVRLSKKIEPGLTYAIPLNLSKGPLKQLLADHPQASLKMEFSLSLDTIEKDGQIYRSIAAPQPVKVQIERTAIVLTPKYLQNRLQSLSGGQEGQRVNAGYLFAGLLAEEQIFRKQEPQYTFAYADWMPPLLKSALLNNMSAGDWGVVVHTIDAMQNVSLDPDMTRSVGEKLTDSNWPVRLAALYLLDKNQDSNFPDVLTWVAEQDQNKLIRDIAAIMAKSHSGK